VRQNQQAARVQEPGKKKNITQRISGIKRTNHETEGIKDPKVKENIPKKTQKALRGRNNQNHELESK